MAPRQGCPAVRANNPVSLAHPLLHIQTTAKLATGDKVNPTQLADDISFALVTTTCGLAIAIPLVLATDSINVRNRKLEDLVGTGLAEWRSSPLSGNDP